jgi:glutamate racemase
MIGIIDSGYGGLSIVQELAHQQRHIPFVYIGDNAHNPYGTKTKSEIMAYGQAMIDYLLAYKPEIETIIIACNTLCAAALPALEQRYPTIMLIPITRFGARGACMSFNAHVTVMATQFTIETGYYPQLITQYDARIITQQINAQPLVAMVESGKLDIRHIEAVVAQIAATSDTLILGCTHFPFLYNVLRPLVPTSVQIVDPAVGCVADMTIRSKPRWQDESTYCTTGSTTAFAHFVEHQHLPQLPVHQIDLAKR